MAWSAPCIDGRCYDYTGLGIVSDFLFVMAYDLRSQIYNLQDCVASANAPLLRVIAGLNNFTDYFQVPTSKLVLGGSSLDFSKFYSFHLFVSFDFSSLVLLRLSMSFSRC